MHMKFDHVTPRIMLCMHTKLLGLKLQTMYGQRTIFVLHEYMKGCVRRDILNNPQVSLIPNIYGVVGLTSSSKCVQKLFFFLVCFFFFFFFLPYTQR